ncbi:MAG: hypothetical protein HRU41_06085 [Saprospiraceae bacterium]|nr:hypothetical protein [Saprospiraceae bacterium]
MQPFYHHLVQQTEKFIQQFSQLNGYYLSKSLEIDDQLPTYLSEIEQYFTSIRATKAQLAVASLSSYLETAKRGFNPVTLEKVRTGRRENYWISIFSILQKLQALLIENLEDNQQKLRVSNELLQQLILSALQEGLISEEQFLRASTLDGASSLWDSLNQHVSLRNFARKIKATIHPKDIHLLISDVVVSMI